MYEAYNKKLLRVNLTDKSYTTEEIPLEVLNDYIGGMGTGTFYLTREVSPEADAVGPENKLIFSTGPLTGTGAPLFAQTALVTKSPLTGGVINNYCGGSLAQKIKSTGYDMVIIEGVAQELMYIVISEDKVEFVPCPELKGKDVGEVESTMKQKAGQDCGTAAIGLAGETRVHYSSIISATRVFGRGGNGAVMGSKNLKGIAFSGSRGVKVNDPQLFAQKAEEAFAAFKKATDNEHGLLGMFSRFGTGGGLKLLNDSYVLATKNHQMAHFETGEKINTAAYHKLGRSRRIACFGCPVHCGQLHSFESGDKPDFYTRGPEYETMYSLGSDCFNDDPMVLAHAHDLCEKYGMDTLSAGCTIAFAMECYEKGILTEEEIGFPLPFGAGEGILKMLEMIARREGVGDLLADGTKRMAEKLGGGSEDFAMNVKGMEFAAWMPQRMTGVALTFAVSNRGACHKRGPMGAELMGVLPMESTEGKAAIVMEIQDRVNALFTLVGCRFADFEVPIELFIQLMNAATGLEKSPDEFQLMGERIWNLERLYNLASGMTAADDTLPARCFEPVDVRGEMKQLDEKAFRGMVKEYYKLRGWDEEGVPTQERLKRLGVSAHWSGSN